MSTLAQLPTHPDALSYKVAYIVQLLLNKDRRIGLLLYNMLFKCLSRFTDDKHLNGNVFEHLVNKLASSTLAREKSDIDRFLPHIGHYKLTELRPEHFRKLYVALRKEKNMINGSTAATARARLFTMRDGL